MYGWTSIRAKAALHVYIEASGYGIASERRLGRQALMHESKIITLYMLQRAGRLLCASIAAMVQSVCKGRKLSIDAAELLGYAVKRNLGQPPLRAVPGIEERASIIGSVGQITSVANGMTMPIEVRFSAINEPVGGNYAFGEFLTATELGTS